MNKTNDMRGRKNWTLTPSLTAGLCFLVGITLLGIDALGANLLPNPSFEDGTDSKPAAWKSYTWSGQGELAWEPTGKTGSRSVAISSSNGGDLSWQINMPVHPDSIYRLSGWIKTENVKATTGQGALLNVHEFGDARTSAVTGNSDWTRVECEFETGSRSEILVNCLFGGWGLATGKAYFDNVQLELLHKADREHPAATVNFNKELGPINPFIYGQFIEHLGRCIYGGIWAEMLEDRKFNNQVLSVHSPWKKLGGEVGWSLDADVERSYVGSWSVKISVTDRAPAELHGMKQGGLGVVTGKEYVGRVVLAGKGTVEAALVWGKEPAQCQTIKININTSDFATYPIQFKAGATTDNAELRLGLRGTGTVWIGTVSLMPADNIHGMRADTIARLKELNSPIYRWPGGNFVSGYDWRDGIGPRDRRPPRKNPAWQGIEHNDFGIDEFITYCRELNTEPLVVVNTGLGSPELAAALVEYCNGAATTEWGKRRTANGHPEPYNVKWWGIGNEMYGGWQLGHVNIATYVARHNEIVRIMRQVDPDMKLIAVGATGNWSEEMLKNCSDAMDMLSEHFYCGENKDLETHIAAIPNSVHAKAVAHRRYHETIPSLAEKRIPIALDEWNYWYGQHLYGELGVRYFLRDALGVARGIHEMVRNCDVFQMANYAQTVNVIGCIKTSKTAAGFATTGLPLKLYRQQFGTLAVAVEGRPTPLDVAAALTADRKKATIAVVNPTTSKLALNLRIQGGTLGKQAVRYLITGKDPMDYNDPGKTPAVKIVESAIDDFAPESLQMPPISVALFVVEVRD